MNWDYLAGFFDGEGCIKKHYKRNAYRADISQLDVGVLELIRDFLLEKKIYCKVYKDGHYYKKNCKRLQINGFDDILRFASFMKDRVIVKRKQFEEIIKLMSTHKPIHTWKRPWIDDGIEQMMRNKEPWKKIMNKYSVTNVVLCRVKRQRNIPDYLGHYEG